MKKLILIPVIVALLGVNVYAADKGDKGSDKTESSARVSRFVMKQFAVDFEGAQNVTWTVGNDFVKADFTVNNEVMTAFYKPSGDYMGSTHLLDVRSLPAKTIEKINDNYSGYTIGDVILYTTNENADVDPVSYFVDLKNAKHEVMVRVSLANNIEFFKQIK